MSDVINIIKGYIENEELVIKDDYFKDSVRDVRNAIKGQRVGYRVMGDPLDDNNHIVKVAKEFDIPYMTVGNVIIYNPNEEDLKLKNDK